MVAIGWDGEDLIAFALGQELMLALRHAVSCPQKVIWAYGQRGVKRHSMWTDMGGAQRLPSIASTERPFGRRTGWAIFWVMPASAPAIRDRKSTRLNSSHYCASRMPSSACKKKNNEPYYTPNQQSPTRDYRRAITHCAT